MKMKKFIAVLSMVSMMAVAVVGCGSSDNGDDSGSGSDAGSSCVT